MKLSDSSQRLPFRIGFIQAFAIFLFVLLGGRLFYLQVVKGEYFSNRAENQRVRLIPIVAPRGAIFDREGRILVDSRPTYNVVVANESIKNYDLGERSGIYASGLTLNLEFVTERQST